MTHASLLCGIRQWLRGLLLLPLLVFTVSSGRAAVQLRLELFQDHNANGITYYYAYPFLDVDPPPATSNYVTSAGGQLRYAYTTNGTLDLAGGSFPTIGDVIHEMTNGLWTLVLNSNHVSQATYKFAVSVTNLNVTTYPPVNISEPAHNATTVPPHPAYAWSGPTNFAELQVSIRNPDFSFFYAELVDPHATGWTNVPSLLTGPMQFEVNYATTNTASMIHITTPTNASGALAGWTTEAKLRTYRVHEFTVPTPTLIGHTLVAHYRFDSTNSSGDVAGTDSSGNGYNINGSSGWGTPGHEFSSDAIAGSGSVEFHGFTALAPPDEVVQSLAGSFTVSAWVKTLQLSGGPTDPGYSGAGVIWAQHGYPNHDSIPLSITGGKAAFYTANAGGPDNTVHSTNDISTGDWVHVVVTRSQVSGLKKIYVNGQFDSQGVGITAALDGAREMFDLLIGGAGGFNGYEGLVDDVQFYTGVLSDSEIAALYSDPGSTAPNVLFGGTVAHYRFDDTDVPGRDDSGNALHMNFAGGSDGGSFSSLEAIAGHASMNFFRLEPSGGGARGWNPTPAPLLSALTADFSVSLWVKTTDDAGNSGDYAFNGAGILAADVPGLANDVIPVALTAGEVAFNTGGDSFDETLNSATTVNDGEWHHIVVTRDQETGEKRIYVDGFLDVSGFGTTNLLSDPQLLTLGALADASQSDPNFGDYYNGFDGLIDDVQIYSRVLGSGEVNFLFNNPGSTTDNIGSLGPISVNIVFSIYREHRSSGDVFYAFPQFFSVSPDPITTNRVLSPNGLLLGTISSGDNGASSVTFTSLQDLVNEITNGDWTLTINEGHATQRTFTFIAGMSGLDTNVLGRVTILSPADGATNVVTNPTFTWSGPPLPDISGILFRMPGFQFLNAVSLASPATNWPAPAPVLTAGTTNQFFLEYSLNNAPQVFFSTPMDSSSQPVDTWEASTKLISNARSDFVVGNSGAPTPVQLLGVQANGGNVQFSFTTQNGLNHVVELSTNLATGLWISVSNFPGNGLLKNLSFPITNGPQRFYRVGTH